MIPDAIHDDLPRLAHAWLGAGLGRRLPRRAFEPALNGIAVVGAIRLLLRSPAGSAPNR
jgi:uncharacterized membrane protein YfcA